MQRLSIQPLQCAMRSSMQLHARSTGVVPFSRALLSTTGHHHNVLKPSSKTTATTAQPSSKTKTKTPESENVNPELPKFSLDGLGVSKNMKVFLIVVLSIFGTMETWFYCKAIWRWWKGDQGLAVTAEEK